MVVSRRTAYVMAMGGVTVVAVLLALDNSLACEGRNAIENLETAFLLFMLKLLLALAPALVALFLGMPLRALGACLFVAPWLVVPYYVDCVPPYPKDASLSYLYVVFWGIPCGAIGALLANRIANAIPLVLAER